MKIRKALLEAGMSQKEFATLVGMSQPTLNSALSKFELSAGETNRLIRIIREAAKKQGE